MTSGLSFGWLTKPSNPGADKAKGRTRNPDSPLLHAPSGKVFSPKPSQNLPKRLWKTSETLEAPGRFELPNGGFAVVTRLSRLALNPCFSL